jgi:hypothetical protein
MSNRIIVTAVGIAGVGITIGTVFLIYQLQGLERAEQARIILITEDFHPQDSSPIGIEDPIASDTIHLNARWNKPVVTMSVTYDETVDTEFRQRSLELIKAALLPGNGIHPYAS